MDLSFINLPTSQDELLGLLRVAYNAGQNSVYTPGKYTIAIGSKHPAPEAKNSIFPNLTKRPTKSTFKQWLTRMATLWEDMKHS